MTRYTKKSKIKKIKIIRNDKKETLIAEIINMPSQTLGKESKEKFIDEASKIIISGWGDFGKNFFEKHLLPTTSTLFLRTKKGDTVGFASISKKNILKKEIYYFEFTVIDKKYELLGLAQKINALLAKGLILESLLHFHFDIEFLLLTPNMRVLGMLTKIADFIYPNPYDYNPESKKIPPADQTTWLIAKKLIEISDNPNRYLSREGCVLRGSYDKTPWLIYKKDNIPQYKDDIVNEFGEKYLEYSKEAGNELVVRLKVNLLKAFMLVLLKRL